jgi:hypothetical protein
VHHLQNKQFNKLISTIRTLIDAIEKHRLKDLSDMDPLGEVEDKKATQQDIFSGLGFTDNPLSALPSAENEGDFDFLNTFEGNENKSTPKKSSIAETVESKVRNSDPFSTSKQLFPSAQEEKKTNSDMFAGISNPSNKANALGGMSLPKPARATKVDPFSTPSNIQKSEDDIFADMDPMKKSGTSDPFSGIGSANPSAIAQSQAPKTFNPPTIKMTSGFKSLELGVDPFAEIENEEKKVAPPPIAQNDPFKNFSSGISNVNTKPQSNLSGGGGGMNLNTKPVSTTNDPFGMNTQTSKPPVSSTQTTDIFSTGSTIPPSGISSAKSNAFSMSAGGSSAFPATQPAKTAAPSTSMSGIGSGTQMTNTNNPFGSLSGTGTGTNTQFSSKPAASTSPFSAFGPTPTQ